jgi:predicted metal-dependent HD superfamily phosphohydrolase
VIEAIATLSPFPLSAELKRALVDAYATPPRAYHTLEHILDVARHFSGLSWQQPNDVFGAVLFHDAVYEVGRPDNEARSAALAAQHGQSARTQALIELTARHGKLTRAELDDEAAQFLDCDMAILAAEPRAFDRYEQQIAQEYVPVVGEEAYRFGRRRFLEGLLARPHIFFTSHFDERQARDNLRRAL